MSSPNPVTVESGSDERWTFLRDVVVFQLKMFLDNIRDFALMPVSLVAALIDLIFKGKRHGSLFYQVLRWGAHSEEVIDVYSAIEAHERPSVNPNYTVDAVIARLEGVLVRECEKGGTRREYQSRDGPGDRSNPNRNERAARSSEGSGGASGEEIPQQARPRAARLRFRELVHLCPLFMFSYDRIRSAD